MRVAYLDCFSGISGDMTLGALIDAGVSLEAIQQGIDSLGLPSCRLEASQVKKNGFRATHLKVLFEPEHKHRHLHHIVEMIERSSLTPRQQELAIKIFTRLGQAEAKVHGTTIEKVHFHEVGAVDSIADIVGSAIGWDLLGVERIECAPIPTGTGTVKIAHGVVSVPAPATAELLAGIPLAACSVPAELTTPTGAAIAASLVDRFGGLPAMRIETIGYGAGTRDLEDRPNILRLVVGEVDEPQSTEGVEQDSIWILETNLDDVPGEWIGYCTQSLLEAGALDVYTTPIQMKKNRPAVTLTVLCHADARGGLEQIIFAETGSLGIRCWTAQRHILARRAHAVQTPWGTVEGKVAMLAGGRELFSPEYESCRQLAVASSQPLRDVYRAAQQAFDLSPTLVSDTRGVAAGRWTMWLLADMFSKDIVKTGMFLVGVVLLIMILLRRFHRYYGRRRPAKKAAESYLAHVPRPGGQHRSLSNASPDILSWHVEMHETAREMKAELDSKMRALQLLIGQARHEADRLEQILGRFEATDTLPDARPSSPPASWLPGSADRQLEIFALADQGCSAAEIAEQVGSPLGEVELILSLRGAP